MELGSTAWRMLDLIADAYDPLVALFALVVPPFLTLPRRGQTLLRFYIAAGLGLAVVYAIQAVDARYQLWHSVGLDYSTHSAFAASVVVSVSVLRRAWLPAFASSLALYFALVLALGYHGIVDIATAAALASSATWLAHRSLRQRQSHSGQGSVPSTIATCLLPFMACVTANPPGVADALEGKTVLARLEAIEYRTYTDYLDDGSVLVSDMIHFSVVEPEELAGLRVKAYDPRTLLLCR